MPNRREPLTKDMATFLVKKSAVLNLPDGKYAIMTDWFILALQAGFRRMKWSQDFTKIATTKSFQCNIDGSSSAFIQSDFQFRGPNGRRIVYSPSLYIDDIETVKNRRDNQASLALESRCIHVLSTQHRRTSGKTSRCYPQRLSLSHVLNINLFIITILFLFKI